MWASDCAQIRTARRNNAVDMVRLADRTHGNRRNPGTTADFIAAVIFAGLREGRIV